MRLGKKLLLIKRIECEHKWSFSDGMAPRWCLKCDIRAGSHLSKRMNKIRFILGKGVMGE